MEEALRKDELFVIESLCSYFKATWKVGENPPDAYLCIADKKIAVEISTLFQLVPDAKKGIASREGQDELCLRIFKKIKDEFEAKLADDQFLMVTLYSPLSEPRKFNDALRERVSTIVDDLKEYDKTVHIFGNKVDIHFGVTEEKQSAKVHGFVPNRNSSPDILMNAIQSLEDRISVKTGICAEVAKTNKVWLALLNEYQSADAVTYQQAIQFIQIHHLFEKIFVVSGNREVVAIY